MKILVIGGTGNVGREVVKNLQTRGAAIRVLARRPEEAGFDGGLDVVPGDLTDPVSVRAAMQGVDKLFLLNAVVPDELTQALIACGIAKQAGVRHVTYVSVFQADRFRDVPHFAAKVAVEAALIESGLSFTILRPGYYFQNDLGLKPLLLQQGIYAMPIGTAGISAVDVRDIAEAAAISLTEQGHERQSYNLVGSTPISGPGNAALWSEVLGRQIVYTGHDFDAWEQQLQSQMPGWMAYDMRTMLQGYYERGFSSTPADADRMTKLLGHAPRTYEAFARQAGAEWRSSDQR